MDRDVESDGAPLPWPMDDERQLSSDLENILKLHPENEYAGASGHIEPKPEERSTCMFGNQSGSVRGENFNHGASVFAQDGGLNYQNPPHVLTHPSGTEVSWNHWQHPGSWRSGNSLSSNDLEMDREPSMAPFSQIMSPGSKIPGVDTSKIPLTDIQLKTEPISRYPHEDKLMRYDGQTMPEFSNHQHQLWQQNIQQQPSAAQQYLADDAMDDDENVTYSVEVDEYGEGPLHTLSVVTDKSSLAKNLNVLISCNVVQSCINVQNKLKQTPLFLAVMEGNLSFVSWLLDQGADPNIQGTLYIDRYEYIWRSPLHMAAMNGDKWIHILRILLNKLGPGDINRCSHGDKLSALHLALKHHSLSLSCRQIILELVKHDADVTLRDQSNSKTPLMLALETRDLPLVEEFINSFSAERRRIMLQEQTRSGDTCLHIAAGLSRISKQDKLKLLRLLVINGANGNIANNARELPRDLAREEWDCIRKT